MRPNQDVVYTKCKTCGQPCAWVREGGRNWAMMELRNGRNHKVARDEAGWPVPDVEAEDVVHDPSQCKPPPAEDQPSNSERPGRQ